MKASQDVKCSCGQCISEGANGGIRWTYWPEIDKGHASLISSHGVYRREWREEMTAYLSLESVQLLITELQTLEKAMQEQQPRPQQPPEAPEE